MADESVSVVDAIEDALKSNYKAIVGLKALMEASRKGDGASCAAALEIIVMGVGETGAALRRLTAAVAIRN